MDPLNPNSIKSPISDNNGNGNSNQTEFSSQMISVLNSVEQWGLPTNQAHSHNVQLVWQNGAQSSSHAFRTPVHVSQATGQNAPSVCDQISYGCASQNAPKSVISREEIKQKFKQLLDARKTLAHELDARHNCLQVTLFETKSILEGLKEEIKLKEALNEPSAQDDYVKCLKAFHENTIIMQKTQFEMDLVKPQIEPLEEDISLKEQFSKNLETYEARIKEAGAKLHDYDTQTGQPVIGPLCIKRSRIFNSLTEDVHKENSSKDIQLKQKQRRDELSKIGKTIQDFEKEYMALKLQIYSSQCELNTLIDELHQKFATELS